LHAPRLAPAQCLPIQSTKMRPTTVTPARYDTTTLQILQQKQAHLLPACLPACPSGCCTTQQPATGRHLEQHHRALSCYQSPQPCICQLNTTDAPPPATTTPTRCASTALHTPNTAHHTPPASPWRQSPRASCYTRVSAVSARAVPKDSAPSSKRCRKLGLLGIPARRHWLAHLAYFSSAPALPLLLPLLPAPAAAGAAAAAAGVSDFVKVQVGRRLVQLCTGTANAAGTRWCCCCWRSGCCCWGV
jgi:hypothetical protein